MSWVRNGSKLWVAFCCTIWGFFIRKEHRIMNSKPCIRPWNGFMQWGRLTYSFICCLTNPPLGWRRNEWWWNSKCCILLQEPWLWKKEEKLKNRSVEVENRGHRRSVCVCVWVCMCVYGVTWACWWYDLRWWREMWKIHKREHEKQIKVPEGMREDGIKRNRTKERKFGE